MKKSSLLFAAAFAFGLYTPGFSGNNPANPSGPGIPLSAARVEKVTGPKWARTAVPLPGAVVQVGAWYRDCPVMPGKVLTKFGRVETTLSNGKRITLGCMDCKKEVEKDLKKYEDYMYF